MGSQSAPPHRVLLVREWDEQMSGSGCCGRLGSEAVGTLSDRPRALTDHAGDQHSAGDPYARTRADMERVGAVYRALRERFPDDQLELTVVDPRNSVWLLPVIWRDARRRGLTAGQALRQVNAGTSACALVCDGLVLATDPAPEQAVQAVQSDIAERITS